MHILCVKSILSGVSAATSLNHGNGIVATHNPIIAATSNLVHSGRRKIYERSRKGLNCGYEGIVTPKRERKGGVVASRRLRVALIAKLRARARTSGVGGDANDDRGRDGRAATLQDYHDNLVRGGQNGAVGRVAL